jgi:hypothetical protein
MGKNAGRNEVLCPALLTKGTQHRLHRLKSIHLQAEWAKSTRHAANGLVIALEYRRCQCGTLVIDRPQTEVEIRLCSCRSMQSPK